MRRTLTILGATGSVGRQALDVVRAHPDRFEVVGLSANSDAGRLAEQAAEFGPRLVALEGGDATPLRDGAWQTIEGPGAAEKLAEAPADVVLNSIVGFAGLAATVRALEAGNRVALANKESLVAGGEWVMSLAEGNPLLPVDSEHSAIFQCLEGRTREEVDGILITASGGPFYDADVSTLREVGPADALKHPTWEMGPKITIDSALMMNKGLEVIEAHHLFGVPYDDIRVAVHRQSVIHGGVFFRDGAVMLHAAVPDMRLPIAYALLHPGRVDLRAETVPFDGTSWSFEEPRNADFRCLPLAVEAGRAGGPYPVALNAAKEVAVDAFIDGRLGFMEIADTLEDILQDVPDPGTLDDLATIRAVDDWGRRQAERRIGRVGAR